jgi:hypothetical protein
VTDDGVCCADDDGPLDRDEDGYCAGCGMRNVSSGCRYGCRPPVWLSALCELHAAPDTDTHVHEWGSWLTVAPGSVVRQCVLADCQVTEESDTDEVLAEQALARWQAGGPLVDPATDLPPDLGKNGLHDIAPHVDLSLPASAPLAEHFAKRRRLTLDAIVRGLELSNIEPIHGQAISVLYELEKMWRNEEAFS